MSNIVVIDDDDRVIQEMARFVSELGEDNNFRSFKTAEYFMKRYTGAGNTEELFESETAKSFDLYSEEQLADIQRIDFSKKAPHSDESLEITINKDDGKILKIPVSESPELFGLNSSQIVEQEQLFENFISESYKDVWEKCLREVEENSSVLVFCVITANENSWLINVKITLNENEYVINLKDYTEESEKIIKKNLNDRVQSQNTEMDLISSIDVVIFKNDLIDIDPTKWVVQARNHLKKNGFFPKDGVTRFIVSKFDDDKVEKSVFFHPFIEDILFFPLDRLLFLQKMQIILKLPEKASPQFLFLQAVKRKVEISKKIIIEKINDIAVAIKTPSPLKNNVPSIIFFKFPTSEKYIRVNTKSSSSQKHLEGEGYLVFFDFFGIDRPRLINIKRYVQESNEYQNLLSKSDRDFEFLPDSEDYSQDQKRKKTVVVLDVDEEKRKKIVDRMNEGINNINCVDEGSYYFFEKKYLTKDSKKASPLKSEELYCQSLVWKVKTENLDMSSVEPPPKEDDKICEHPASKFFGSTRSWMSFFEDDESKILLDENIENLKSSKVSKETTIFTEFSHLDQSKRSVKILLKREVLEQSIDEIELTLLIPTHEELKVDTLSSVDLIILNSRMIPVEFTEWRQDIQNKIEANKLNLTGGEIPLVVIADEQEYTQDNFSFLFRNDISGLFVPPLETKSLCHHVSRVIDNPFSMYRPDNLGWLNVSWKAYAGKTALLVEISEFGCTIRTEHPLQSGTFIFLHGFIYEKAPDENLCCRVYFHEKDPHESDGDYLCYLIYFGIDDSFLKYLRSWIRENYAQIKEKSSSSQ